jgi:hypothetical protein
VQKDGGVPFIVGLENTPQVMSDVERRFLVSLSGTSPRAF